jgi:transposase
LSDEQQRNVKAVAADKTSAYMSAVTAKLPNPDVVHDTFQVSKHLGEAVDKVRRKENKALSAEGDDTLERTRFLWLVAAANLSPEQRRRFKAIKNAELETARARAVKEHFRWFWRHVYWTSAAEFFARWYG